jgi:hypothetical protein
MKKFILIAIICLSSSVSTLAGEHTDALSQCLTTNTTEADKAVMARWVYSTLSQHPSIKPIATLTIETTNATNQEMATLIETFMYNRCKIQVKNAVQYEGPKAIENSIRTYAQTTGQDILRDPSITKNVTDLAKHLDLMKLFQALMTD